MPVKYARNPGTLTLVNPGKPKKKSKPMAAKKKKSSAKKKTATSAARKTKRSASARAKALKSANAVKAKQIKTLKQKVAKQKVALAKAKAKPAKRKGKRKAAGAAAAAAVAAAVRKTSASARKTKRAAPKRKPAASKAARRKSSLKGTKRAYTVTSNGKVLGPGGFVKATPAVIAKMSKTERKKYKSYQERINWKKAGAVAPKWPKKKPTAKSKRHPDHTKVAKSGRPRPGIYPIKGYSRQGKSVSTHWARRNPRVRELSNGAKIMPNGTVFDPTTRKIVSASSSRGRALLRGNPVSKRKSGRKSRRGRKNPGALSKISIMGVPVGKEFVNAGKQVGAAAVGFFAARATANYVARQDVSMLGSVPLIGQYLVAGAPVLSQLAFGVGWAVLATKVEALTSMREGGLVGVGLSVVEAAVRRYAPVSVGSYLTAPELEPAAGMAGYDIYSQGMGDPWSGYYPGDQAVRAAMGEYVLPEDLNPDFDVDASMGDYVLESDLDPEFDVGAGMGDFVLTSDLDPSFDAVGDYVPVSDLDSEFDFWGGMGDVQSISRMAREQIALGAYDRNDYESVQDLALQQAYMGAVDEGTSISSTPVITNTYGPPAASGMFGTGDVAAMNQAVAVASTAISAVKASGGTPEQAIAQAYAAVQANVPGVSKADAKQAVVKAMRAAWRGQTAGSSEPSQAYPTDADEQLEEESGEAEFRSGMFRNSIFDLENRGRARRN